MTQRNIIWRNSIDQLAITYLTDECKQSSRDHSSTIAESHVGWTAVGFDEKAPVPTWPFQKDWRYITGMFSVDFAAAQESTANRLRAEREPLLAKLDTLELIARRRGEDLADIFAEKQRLCDITIEVSACTTLDQLASLKVASEFPGV